MRIKTLVVENFRGINRVEARDLGDTIIIAGQNGSGKSCIFDAIRLLKSTYGGYQQNEWQQFFGEFAIQLHGGASHLRALFNDAKRPLLIECYFELRDNERSYIARNASDLLEEVIWQNLLPEAFQFGGYRKALFAAQFRERQPEVKERIKNELPQLMKELASPYLLGRIQITPAGEVFIEASILLSLIFTTYRPREIGVIDFHGAQRHYGRENVQGINLNLEQANNQQRQHTLYNYNNKYNNVKSEMAGNFVKELLAEKAIEANRETFFNGSEQLTLNQTLKELFESFFPDKKFLGPTPTQDGSLSFPVQTQSGATHDLDELSSGEKEILYGYLRIRSSAPRDSIILLDEPELHLNPRLVRGLPEFYRQHLGEALQNQLWLVTHSDALIREAVGKPGFNVFHMLPCGADAIGNSQLKSLSFTHDVEMVVADLVGDLAAFRPGGKGLLFEGGGDSDFDKTFVGQLFSEELRGVNLLSGSNKMRVRVLHEVLDRAYQNGDLPTKFFAITDRDSDFRDNHGALSTFQWDVYHVENYLLVPNVIADVMNSLKMSAPFDSVTVEDKLRLAARAAIPKMFEHQLLSHANSVLVQLIDLKFSPKSSNIPADLAKAVDRSVAKIKEAAEGQLTEANLSARSDELRQVLEKSFADGSWKSNLPGREILKQFVSQEAVPVGYEIFRNLIVSRMVESGHKPAGMAAVIQRVTSG